MTINEKKRLANHIKGLVRESISEMHPDSVPSYLLEPYGYGSEEEYDFNAEDEDDDDVNDTISDEEEYGSPAYSKSSLGEERLLKNYIKNLVRESIGEAIKGSDLGGVFSTDDPKAAKAVKDDEGYDDFLYPEDWKTRKNREDLANLIDKRSRGEDAELELDNYLGTPSDWQMEKDYQDEKDESDRYEKPFGDFDSDIENLWSGDPDLESADDEGGIAGIGGPRKLAEASSRGYVWKNGKFVKGGDESIYIKTHDDKPSEDFKFSDKEREACLRALEGGNGKNGKKDKKEKNENRNMRALRSLCENIAREAVGRYVTEGKKKGSKKSKKSKKEKSSKSLNSQEKTIMTKLNSDGVNAASYYYKLYNAKTDAEKAAARSKGYKKAKGKKNSTGARYRFTSKERNKLNSMLTDK